MSMLYNKETKIQRKDVLLYKKNTIGLTLAEAYELEILNNELEQDVQQENSKCPEKINDRA